MNMPGSTYCLAWAEQAGQPCADQRAQHSEQHAWAGSELKLDFSSGNELTQGSTVRQNSSPSSRSINAHVASARAKTASTLLTEQVSSVSEHSCIACRAIFVFLPVRVHSDQESAPRANLLASLKHSSLFKRKRTGTNLEQVESCKELQK